MPSTPAFPPEILDQLRPLIRDQPDYDLEQYVRNTQMPEEFRLYAQQALDERAAAKAAQYAALRKTVGFLHCGVKHDPGGDSWTRWMLFPASVSDEDALERCGWHAFGPISDYSPTGQSYGWDPRVRRTRSRVLVTQNCGLDV